MLRKISKLECYTLLQPKLFRTPRKRTMTRSLQKAEKTRSGIFANHRNDFSFGFGFRCKEYSDFATVSGKVELSSFY